MINVIILTSSSRGFASAQLTELVKSEKIKVKSVVISQGLITNRIKYIKRKINKAYKIGLFGVLNGIRMRKWYSDDTINYMNLQSVESLCAKHNISLNVTPTINCNQTIECFNNAKADIGLSLGNGYIGYRVFSIPKFGMINIHHEELPAYQNAQSIIWQLYNNSINTGYTIHKIDKNIDTGSILFKERFPIIFKETLKKTIFYTYSKLWEKSSEGLVKVLENFEGYLEESIPQENGNTYTTPSLRHYLIILKNFKRLKR